MKSFDFLLCFLLCVLSCVFTVSGTSKHEMEMMSRSMSITAQDLQECLDKSETDLDTIKELSSTIYKANDNGQYTEEMVRKVSCVGACVYKKNGVLVNSKIIPENLIELVSKQTGGQSTMPEFMRTTLQKCSNKASSETEDCKIMHTFSRCFVQEMKPN